MTAAAGELSHFFSSSFGGLSQQPCFCDPVRVACPKTAGINVWNGKDRMYSHDIVHDAHVMFGTGGFAQTGAPQTKRLPQLQCWQNDQQQQCGTVGCDVVP